MLKRDAARSHHEPVRLAVVTAADLPLLEQFVRAYCVEDRHTFEEDRQPAALAALAAGEPFGPRLAGQAGRALRRLPGAELVVQHRGRRPGGMRRRARGLGSNVLALVEAEARAFGVRRIFLEVERHNRVIGLYRRAGYADHDRFLMSKLLSP